MSLENLEIIDGEAVKENLKPEEVDVLVEAFIESTSRKVDLTVLETHEAVQEALDRKGRADALTRHIYEVIDEGDMVIARVDGKIAGMISGYLFTYRYHPDPENEHFVEVPVIEMGKGRVLDSFQDNGIYSKMRAKLFSNLKVKHPNAMILAATKDTKIKTLCSKNPELEEISFERYLRIHNDPEPLVQAKLPKMLKGGWTAFLHIPAALKQKLE